MNKRLFLCCLAWIAFLSGRAQSFDVSSNGATVVVHEAFNDRLFVYNIPHNKKSEITIDVGSENWIDLVADSLVMVHYTYSADKTVLYSLASGKKLFAWPQHCFTHESETELYWIDRDWTLYRYSLADLTAPMTVIKFSADKDAQPSGYFQFSADSKRIAVAYNRYERGYVGVFDLQGGKELQQFPGFECCAVFSRGATGGNMYLFDMDHAGSLLMGGNDTKASLFNIAKGREIAALKTPQSGPADFGSAAFSADGKTVYLQGQQTIYILGSKNFSPKDTISAAGKWVPYGTPATYAFQKEFIYKGLRLTKDNRYLFLLCQPANGEKPFIVRRKASDNFKGAVEKFWYR
ncbi:MAG TPA: hypothetical protein VER36_12600 [Flavisolibacter sp.]|nr:hypothetical protein [Flavisolibacter sp.]